MRSIPVKLWEEFVQWLFKQYPNVMMIYVHHTTTPQPFPSTQHCHINLPETVEAFNEQLSSRVRYNTKWYPKKIKEAFGDYKIQCWLRDEMPQQIYQLFKTWKKDALGYIVPDNFLDQHVVTHVYGLVIQDEYVAVGFVSCIDDGEDVFYASTAYNANYAKWSVGSVLYYHIVCELIRQHKKRFLLHGGEGHTYKHMFNGSNTETWNGYLFHPEIQKICDRILSWNSPSFLLKGVLYSYYKMKLKKAKYQALKKCLKFYKK